MKTEPTSRSSEKTRRKILDASQKLFAARGFSGASISQIAAEAGVNLSLIYHYVKSKEDLWKETKCWIMEKHPDFSKNFRFEKSENLEEFCEKFIKFVMEVYKKYPELWRMLSWQRMEKEGRALIGLPSSHFVGFLSIIKTLQQKGEVGAQSDPELLMAIILNLIAGPWVVYLMNLPDNYQSLNSYISIVHKISKYILKEFSGVDSVSS
jgi:AcrR family transcriptional regulator